MTAGIAHREVAKAPDVPQDFQLQRRNERVAWACFIENPIEQARKRYRKTADGCHLREAVVCGLRHWDIPLISQNAW
jgi:hypothetical protein